MGWGATLLPLSDFAQDWEWLAGCAVDPLPDAPPTPRPAVRAVDVLHLLRAAGLSGWTSPRIDDELDVLLRDDAATSAYAATTLTDVLLHPRSEPDAPLPERIDRDTPVVALGLTRPHPHAALRAAQALVPVWGPTVAMEHSGCRSLVVDGVVADLDAAVARWFHP
ncbi:hypothetical protein GC089_17975 [Cellulomonas sp. JZ18]|uniref:hypothetical protein n=1 Tax=Cellulomonas sp. JZ18 TaxID=2654191 RepID=UPI0012D4A916|nr:hypothetical protein [Cellulomonas sp. JZ18]QGQ20731.1 hypothetical protein GC089_17975 [Cellulomonas sp. JZ18]